MEALYIISMIVLIDLAIAGLFVFIARPAQNLTQCAKLLDFGYIVQHGENGFYAVTYQGAVRIAEQKPGAFITPYYG